MTLEHSLRTQCSNDVSEVGLLIPSNRRDRLIDVLSFALTLLPVGSSQSGFIGLAS